MRKNLTIILLILFCIYLPVFAAEKWGRDDSRWGRGGDEAIWSLEDLPYIVDWWRIEEGVTTDDAPSDSGDVVWAWYGSINGLSIAQSTNSKRPEYRTDQINGCPAIVFDGADDYLQGAFGATYDQPYSWIIVCTEVTAAGSDRYMFTDDNHFIPSLGYKTSANKYRAYAGLSFYGSTYVPGKPWRIWSIRFDGANSTFRVNGAAYNGNPSTAANSGITIGATNLGGGDADISITDIIVCNAGLTTEEFQHAERWLNEHRGGIY